MVGLSLSLKKFSPLCVHQPIPYPELYYLILETKLGVTKNSFEKNKTSIVTESLAFSLMDLSGNYTSAQFTGGLLTSNPEMPWEVGSVITKNKLWNVSLNQFLGAILQLEIAGQHLEGFFRELEGFF